MTVWYDSRSMLVRNGYVCGECVFGDPNTYVGKPEQDLMESADE